MALLFALINSSISADEEERVARGGNMLPSKLLIEQFDQAIANGNPKAIRQARDKIIYFASQPRRDDYERLKLFQTLTEHALKEENLEDYKQTIAAAKSYQEDFGHYLNLHHFYSESDQIKADIVDSMIWLAKSSSKRIDNVSVRFIWRIYNYINEKDQQKTFQLLEGLYQYGFPTNYSPVSMDGMYLKLIKVYLEESKIELAREVFRNAINDVIIYMEIWHDKRFKVLWPLLEENGKFDPVLIIEKDLQRAIDFLQSDEEMTWNEWIDTRARIVILNRSLGRYQQAVDFALETIQEVPKDIQQEDSFFWLKEALVYVYNDMGQLDNAKEILDAMLKEDLSESPVLINAYIDYALIMLENDELAQAEIIAQKIVEQYDDYTSDYGRYFAQSVLACVWHKTGRGQIARQLLAEMNINASNNYFATTRTALCLKDSRTVASILRERLEDPDERAEALSFLSHYSDSHGKNKNAELLVFRERVIEEQGLHKMISRYGRTRHWFLPAAYWSDL